MARPSKLSDKKWAEIIRRHAGGEKAADLAREYKVSPTQISRRVTQVAKQVQVVAAQVARAEEAFDSLPVSQQNIARSLADQLRGISDGLASAANHNAQTSARLAKVANERSSLLVDLGAGQIEAEDLKSVAMLVEVSNRASVIGCNLLNANKDKATVGELTLEQLVTGETK